MLLVTALGGKALRNVRTVAQALAPMASRHQLVIGHGNGPQAGLLSLQGARFARVEAHPLDALAAQTESMVGYLIEQELSNLLPFDRPLCTLLTMVEIDPDDPAFQNPTRFIGPLYLREEAERLKADKGWALKPDGDKWRRVVASPEPRRIFEIRPIKWMLEQNTVVIAAGGGGIPTMHEKSRERRRIGAECVIDKDFATELLACELGADLLVLLTDASAACVDWGKPTQRPIRRASPERLAALSFAPGSMGAKVDAACRFATTTGKTAAIGAVADLEKILAGEAGTTISTAEAEIVFGQT